MPDYSTFLSFLTKSINNFLENKQINTRSTIGRLIVFNKLHNQIPQVTETRPIITISPIIKLIEALVIPALK